MTSWLGRNGWPILITVVAAALVIAGFEAIDAVVAGSEVAPPALDGEGEDALALAGLIKVALFLVVSGSATQFVRRRAQRGAWGNRPNTTLGNAAISTET